MIISLTHSMRTNLLSLQKTQSLQDITQLRLSTGKKVNSAIDNPSSYYTSQSLNNRAKDLSALLNSMEQGIQAIKATDEALKISSTFLEQAKAVANQALEKLNKAPTAPSFEIEGKNFAKVKSEKELIDAINSGQEGIILIEKSITISANTQLKLKEGQSIVGATYYDKYAEKTSISFESNNITDFSGLTLANNSNISDLNINLKTNSRSQAIMNTADNKAKINNVNININSSYTSGSLGNFTTGIQNLGSIDFSGNVNIKSTNDQARQLVGIYGYTNTTNNITKGSTLNIDLTSASAHGIYNGTTNIDGDVNIKSNSSVEGFGLIFGETNVFGSIKVDLLNKGSAISSNKFSLHGKANITSNSTNGSVFTNITDGFLAASSKLYMKSADYLLKSSTFNKEAGAVIAAYSDKYTSSSGLWESTSSYKMSGDRYYIHTTDGFKKIGDFPTSEFSKDLKNFMEELSQDDAPPELKSSTSNYNMILTQIDRIIKDATYKGTNLLASNSLKIIFNEDYTSGVNVSGVDASIKGLGISEAIWRNERDILNSITEIENAIQKNRTYTNEFGNYYSIIQTREEFSENLINVLTEGAEDLVLADMNEESANMLALQTKQLLANNALSLASQSNQSVIKFFY